ncbi:cytosolic carboxypeptidase 6 isoform X2 [Zootermopsis nevadensis]|uniref:cytosolic carboxypeptidase 6 isoform X2 n=1 Tax=Zootermopsis nevadensis TaxID=136037 RepID=UPI000B8EE14F|nr:cytosolic carboxypeptidase 6 isoform X2 [Zootermopsis nevadensis]
MDEDSEDSDAEGGLGNVTRVVMRPPGQSGKAKRGHLCFDASFETGNLGRVDLISEYEYDLFIRPDTCNPRFRLWFNFIVDNIRIDQRVIFNIVNFSKHRNLFREGMTPLVKSTSRPKWQRIPNKYVYYYRSPEHQNHYVLSFAFGFDREEDVYQFAFNYPYSYSRCQAHLQLLERRQVPYIKRELLTNTVQQRRLDVLTITNPSNMKPGNKKQHVVVVLSRIHPGESPTSFVCQGLIDFLVSNHPIAVALREYVTFKIVPMMNPDGVFLGNYRSTLMGFDLNRTWHQISRWGHPTLYAVQAMVVGLDQSKEMELDFVLDLHAHSSLQGVFVYGNTYDDVYRYERHIVFPKLLAQNAEDYSVANTMYNRDSSKAGTTRRYFCTALKDSVNCYTLEVSFFGYQRPNSQGIFQYTEDAYCRLGRNIARTYLDYYRAIGVIPANLPITISTSPDPRMRARSSRSPCTRPRTTRGKAVLRLHELTSVRDRGSSSSDGGGDSPVNLEPRSFQHDRRRSTLLMNYREIPTSLPEPNVTPGLRGLAGRKMRGGGICHSVVTTASRPPPAPPRLAIIDFNKLTRGGLDQATGRGRGKSKRRDTRQNRNSPTANRF